jgi:hypothetical protein
MKFVDLFSEMLFCVSRLVAPRKRTLAALRVTAATGNARRQFRRKR